MPSLIPCSCGCGKSDYANRMVSIQKMMTEPGTTVRVAGTGQRWWVLKECEQAFLAEKKLTEVQKEHVARITRLPWFLRLGSFAAIRDRQRAILDRTHGHVLAMTIANRMAAIAVSPGWFGKLLAKRWRNPRRTAPADREKTPLMPPA